MRGAWQQEHLAAGHIASSVRKQGDINDTVYRDFLLPFLPFLVLDTQPPHRLPFPPQLNLFENTKYLKYVSYVILRSSQVDGDI